MNGELAGLMAGWLVIAGLAAAATVVNALSIQTDRPELAKWEPWLLEGTSTVMLALLGWLPGLALAVSPPPNDLKRPGHWGRFLAVQAGAVLVFSALHVLAMVALRRGLYPESGYRYGVTAAHFIYELRKDLFTYALFAIVYWLIGRRRERWEAAPRRASFDIRENGRMIRAPLTDILAATSAGNYVEFLLADGRRPLMRTTLAAVESELAPAGLVRVHRSWLVNAERVTGLRPDGGGDWTVELGAVQAPLSRRYPEALSRLRSPNGNPATAASP